MKQLFLKTPYIIMLLLIDQYSKIAITHLLAPGEAINLTPFLALHYSRNTGIAFSLLEQNSAWLLSLSTGVIIAFLAYMLAKSTHILSIIGYVLIIAGALGNLCDRLRLGYVVDFIYFHVPNIFRFAIFNLADSFITIGALCIITHEALKPKD